MLDNNRVDMGLQQIIQLAQHTANVSLAFESLIFQIKI